MNPDTTDHLVRQDEEYEYVTVLVGMQLFGLPIEQVHDVFIPSGITPVPLAGDGVLGLLNLRGRIVTAISLRQRLGLEMRLRGQEMAVGIEYGGESFGLIVDGVSEVMRLGIDSREPNPVNLNTHWARISQGVHRLPEGLLVVLDLPAVLDSQTVAKAA